MTTERYHNRPVQDSTATQRPAVTDDEPRDAGALGLCIDIDQMSELECFYQYEALRAAPPELQAQYRIRYAALRRRLLGEGRAA